MCIRDRHIDRIGLLCTGKPGMADKKRETGTTDLATKDPLNWTHRGQVTGATDLAAKEPLTDSHVTYRTLATFIA